MSGVAHTDMVSVTVHGPAGALDLIVPAGAAADDLTREYAEQSGWRQAWGPQPLLLVTSGGRQVPGRSTMAAAGIVSGAVLVATTSAPEPAPTAPLPPVRVPGGAAVGPWLVAAVSAVLAVVAGTLAAVRPDSTGHTVTVALLAVAAAGCVVPLGAHREQRAMVAPALAGAAAFAVIHEPGAVHLPVTVGLSALVASVGAAVARASGAGAREPLNVWMVTGLVWFGLCSGVTLTGAAPQVYWALLLLGALLASRWVPSAAVDVPDRMLIDLDRLAVTAWSARERRPGKRGRTLVPRAGVEELLEHGARVVDAGALAVLATVVVATPQVTATATLGVDAWGATLLCLAVGTALLLVARNLRHRVARGALRLAGAVALVGGVVPRLDTFSELTLVWCLVAVLVVSGVVIAAGVATGRGWRSVTWARRAEIVETLAGVCAIAATVVASGWFRMVWEFRA